MQKPSLTSGNLPSIEQLLVAGGDLRIDVDPLSGLNKYGCSPFPDSQLLAFSSSTASNISTEGYALASRLRKRLLVALSTESDMAVYALEMQRVRREWLQLCELSDLPGLELIFSPSGTETHAVVAQYAGSGISTPALIIMVEAYETGSGVVLALNDNNNVEVVQVSIRLDDGTPRNLVEIDAEVESLVSNALASERRVLLILVDQSKTGLIAPSPACVMALRRRYPENLEVLVDACQFRIGISTLRAYLEQDFMVALTGSKFLTGPSFSALLLLPENCAKRFQERAFLQGLVSADNRTKTEPTNFGLLLRSAVALEELRRFRAVPKAAVINFIKAFAEAISQRLLSDPHFEPLLTPQLDRRPLIEANNWDHLQTIFPFLLYELQPAGLIPLNREQTRNIYQRLQNRLCTPASEVTLEHNQSDAFSIRCQLGQPVACGTRNGIPVSALRLCLSSRLIVEATTQADQGLAIINNALIVLDKTATNLIPIVHSARNM